MWGYLGIAFAVGFIVGAFGMPFLGVVLLLHSPAAQEKMAAGLTKAMFRRQ